MNDLMYCFSVFLNLIGEALATGVRSDDCRPGEWNHFQTVFGGALDRCNKEDDWLRLEVEYALKSGKNVVPVLMPGFRWPTALPESMEAFSRFNGVVWSHDYFDASVEKLANLFVGTRKTEDRQPNRSESRKEAPRISNQYFAASADSKMRVSFSRWVSFFSPQGGDSFGPCHTTSSSAVVMNMRSTSNEKHQS